MLLTTPVPIQKTSPWNWTTTPACWPCWPPPPPDPSMTSSRPTKCQQASTLIRWLQASAQTESLSSRRQGKSNLYNIFFKLCLLFVTKNCCIFMNFCRHLSHQNKSKLNTYIPTKKYFVYIRDPPEKPWFFLLPSFAILFSQSCLTTLTKSISSSLRSFIQRYA